MKKNIVCLLIGLLGLTLLQNTCFAQNTYQGGRSAAFTAPISQTRQTVSLSQNFESDNEIALSITMPIYGFSVSGSIELIDTSNSLVRILLADEYGAEYLVYEVYPLLTDQWQFDFENMAFETAGMQGVKATKIKVVVLNAKLTLTEYHYDTEQTHSTMQRAKSQQQYVIEALNANLQARNIPWVAGETSISSLSYEEKKQMFGGTVPNLNGFEYYKGGIFVMPGCQPEAEQAQAQATLPTELDWRNKDGKNWMTPVKNQGSCNSCWAFAAIGTLEAYCNIYFQQLLNLDLSEQELVSCAEKNGCDGGYISDGLFYVQDNGVVNESCLPYTKVDTNCITRCIYPNEKVLITDYVPEYDITPHGNMKQRLLQSPLALNIHSWWHAVVLSGYKEIQSGMKLYLTDKKKHITIEEGNSLIGSTAWLIKNSWGTNFGDNGYAYITLREDDIVAYQIQGKITFKGYAIIEKPTYWNIDTSRNQMVFVKSNGVLIVSATIDMEKESIIVENGGKLIVDGGALNNVSIEVQSGGQLQITNNGTIKLFNKAALNVQTGATLKITTGSIN